MQYNTIILAYACALLAAICIMFNPPPPSLSHTHTFTHSAERCLV